MNAHQFAATNNLTLKKIAAIKLRIVITMFFAVFVNVNAQFVAAQTYNFRQTGKIRTVISEAATETAPVNRSLQIGEYKFPNNSKTKTDFYFTYSTTENSAVVEKWVALPQNQDWEQFSNQRVRLSGNLENNKLAAADVAPLESLPENYLMNPPATIGEYKIVAVPLTIQPLSAGKNVAKDAVLSITPEQIRNTIFNAPDAVNKFYLEASYGKFSFKGIHHPQVDVVPVTIQTTISANCHDQIINQFTPIVRQRLQEQNINTTNGSVDLGIIIFNDTPGCPNYPFASRGALGERGVPQWVWMPESWSGSLIMAHEIGHALGNDHPLIMRCTDFNNPQSCTVDDAADRSIMTSAGRFYMMPSNHERRRWGWHPPNAFVNSSTATPQTFDLHSPILQQIKESPRQGRFYLRHLTGAWAGWNIYPEARRNSGQFEKYQAADEPFRLGVAVRIGHSNYGDPNALPIILDSNSSPQIEDAPLRENQQISIGGVTIKCIREHSPGWGTRIRVQ